MKWAEEHVDRRDDPKTLAATRDCMLHWRSIGVDFHTNCVFIDEAGFHLHMMRGRAWSRKGKSAKVTVPMQKGISLTILGAISHKGIIDISLRLPTVTVSKKRKVDVKSVDSGNGGTKRDHFLVFISNVMDVLDKNDMKGYFLVMNNASIHHGARIEQEMKDRGYKPLYLPPYSPFLNPIEEFWANVKQGVRRNPLDNRDSLTLRIIEVCKAVTATDCAGWIRHSVSFFLDCEKMEKGI